MTHFVRQLIAFALAILTFAPFLRRAYLRGELGSLGDWWRRASRLARSLAFVAFFAVSAYAADKLFGNRVHEVMSTVPQTVAALCTNIFNATERQTGYAVSGAHTNEIHDLTMPEGARLAESIARRGAHNDGFYLFDSFTNRLAREGLDLENPVWIQTDGTITVRSPAPGIPIEELSLYTTYSNITVYAPLQGSFGFLPGIRWPDFQPSRIWFAVTDRNTRVITWEGAFRDRDTAQPVSFQAEFHQNGDITYRYSPAQTNFTGIGIYRGGAAMSFDRSTVEPFNRLGDEPSTNVPSTFHFPLSTLHLSYVGDLGNGTGDTDDDGLTDWQEIKVYHTDPHLADTDCYGVGDGDEVQNGTDPLNPDTNNDGIPDGTTPEAWSNNVLRATAETANFSVTLLEAVPPGGHASLRVGDLTILLTESGTYWFNLPTNAVNTFSFASHGCGGLLLDASVVSSPPTRGALPDAPYHIEDADGVLGTGRRAESGRFSVYWPWLRLVPRDGTECLHDFETSRIFDVEAGPMPWGSVPTESVSLENLEPADGGYRLSLDNENHATGTLSLGGPWLTGGSRSAHAQIHKCASWGLFPCGFCEIGESLRCAHDADCEAVTTEDGDCTCPPLFIRVNIDDDDGNGVEDRNDTAPAGDDDPVPFRPVGVGLTCCCDESGESREGHVAAIPSCLRATRNGDIFSGGTVQGGESLLLEAIAPSSTNAAISYSVSDGESFTHSVSRRVLAANALLRPDFNGDGAITPADTAFAATCGMTNGFWALPPRATPYLLRVRYAVPSDCSLQIVATQSVTGLVSRADGMPCPTGDTFSIDVPSGDGIFDLHIASPGTNALGNIGFYITDEDDETIISDSIFFQTVDSFIERPYYVARAGRTNRVCVALNSSLCDYTANWNISSSNPIGPKLYESATGGVGATYLEAASTVWVDPGLYSEGYTITAAIDGMGGGTQDSARFDVHLMDFEPITSEFYGSYLNPAYCVRGRTSRFFIDVSDRQRLPDDRIRWTASNPGAVAFSNSCGRIVGVTPSSLGQNTLYVDIDGYDGPRPCITYRSVDETITKLSVWILGTNSEYRTTPTEVSNMVAQVNEIYEQVGMKFVIDSITMMPYDGIMLDLNPNSDDFPNIVSNICSIASGTGGLEIYFVYSLGDSWGGNYGPPGQSFGIVLEAGAGALVLAHEIGHSCGLQDIYYETEDIPALTGDLFHDGMAGDWGSESVDEHYYSPVMTQREIIQGLLMHGVRETANVDLSCGDIHGIWIVDDENEPSYSISNVPVGFFQHGIRQPENQ